MGKGGKQILNKYVKEGGKNLALRVESAKNIIYDKLKKELPFRQEISFDLGAFNKAIHTNPNHCWYKHTKEEILLPVIKKINKDTEFLIAKRIKENRKPCQGRSFWPVTGFTLTFMLNPAKNKKIQEEKGAK